MNNDRTPEKWNRDFEDFLSINPMQPPQHLSRLVLSHVRSLLAPCFYQVFTKLFLIHLLAGTMTLLFCPQFDVELLDDPVLIPILMRFNDHVRRIICGLTFLAGTATLSCVFLNSKEMRLLRKTSYLQFPGLCFASVSIFAMAGHTILFDHNFLIWLFGAVSGAILILEMGHQIRSMIFGKKLQVTPLIPDQQSSDKAP